MKKLLCILLFLMVGCQAKEAESLSLSIGVMPAVDSAPILLAQEKGYFEAAGLKLDVQIYTNAMNRQSALQSGELDGAMTDVIALVNNVNNGFNIKVTTSTDGVFPVLMHENALDKKDIKVGMMEVSVVNYLSDEYLKDYNVEKVYINEIPARMEMIKTQTIDMAVIPEPMASQGALNGLQKVVMESEDAFSPEVMVFNQKPIDENREAIEIFHKVYNQAVQEINENDDEARDILIKVLDLNVSIKNDIVLPEYHLVRIPDEAYIQKIIKWTRATLKQEIELNYADLVDASFIE